MSAPGGPDVTALLAGHVLYPRIGGVRCHGCEWQSWEDGGTHEEHLDRLIREAYADWVLAEWIATAEHLCRRTHPTRWEISTLSKACDACQIAATDATAHLADLLRGQA